MDTIKTAGLTKYYGKSRGIINVDLSVRQGECFGFIGPNGAGKSTTIRSLLGLIRPTSGSASVFGKDIIKEKEEILKNTGYLPSEAKFYTGMKVNEILAFSEKLRGKDCSEERDRLCERLELDRGAKIETLSFGNRKKVAIVCALQSDPSLLILDEPTGGLDPLMQHEFFEIIKERGKKGTTVFISSHILSEIRKNCTRAAVIKEGRIVACEQIDALGKSSAKRITVSGEVDLEGIEGIKDFTVGEKGISFLYSGELNILLAGLSKGRITDLSVSEPDLEEIFLHYYEKAGENA